MVNLGIHGVGRMASRAALPRRRGSPPFRGEARPSACDARPDIPLDPTFVKRVTWHDHGWSHSCRLLETVHTITNERNSLSWNPIPPSKESP